MLHKLSGEITGLGDSPDLVFTGPDFRCEVRATGGRYSVRLKPGRYTVSYPVFNNFTRFICEIEVSASAEFDIRYEAPKMTVRVRNLPAGTGDGMVYLRHPNGSHHGWRVERLEEFEVDFRRVPDLFLSSFDQIGIVVGGREHRFRFKSQIGGTLNIDFSESKTLD